MTSLHNNKMRSVFAVVLCVGLLSACQPQNDSAAAKSEETAKPAKVAQSLPLIEAKVRPLPLAHSIACDEEGCTQYQLYSLETNVPWINEYFDERMKKANPVAFEKTKQSVKQPDESMLSETLSDVRYVAQRGKFADFVLMDYYYPARAAHSMYHNEYITLDLATRKRVALSDIVVEKTESKLLDALYSANSMWLSEHNISREQLKLTDNYYMSAKGIVFVYPLYELASYAEGMSELVLPYPQASGLIKSEYLPSFVDYAAEREKAGKEKP